MTFDVDKEKKVLKQCTVISIGLGFSEVAYRCFVWLAVFFLPWCMCLL